MTPAPRTACLECDLLLPVPALAEGQRAACPRCGHHLAAEPKDGFSRPLALAVAAVVFLAASLTFPFLSLEAGGIESRMTLGQTAGALYDQGSEVVAVLVAAFILGVPAVILTAVLAILVPLSREQNAPWLVPAARLISQLGPWSMVEVFVIGVIVSLVKLASMATVVLGISFWAYAAFTFCLIGAVSGLDRIFLWNAIERVSAR